MKRFHRYLLLLPLSLFAVLSRCTGTNNYDTTDAWSEIYAAIEFKAKECGNRPGYMLYVPDSPPQYGTQLCSISIIRSSCPFHDYPTFCLEMYKIDLPGIGP